jgi:hypothetical protein
MKRCRVGMLAFIRASDFPQNIGVVVRVAALAWHADFDWAIESDLTPIMAADDLGFQFPVYPGDRVLACDEDLVPILPPDGEAAVVAHDTKRRIRRLEHHLRKPEQA